MSEHPFRYVGPDDEHAFAMSQMSDLFAACYDRMISTVKPSAERTLAIRKLQEARMWTNVAILGVEISSR